MKDTNHKRDNNFLLFLLIFFAFFGLVWVWSQKFGVDNLFSKDAPAVEQSDEVGYTKVFGFNEDLKPQVVNDPALGAQSTWTDGGRELVVNRQSVQFVDSNVKFSTIEDSKTVEDQAIAYVSAKGLSGGVTLNYDKVKIYKDANRELVEVKSGEEGEVLEAVFSDEVSGEDKVVVYITGNGDVWKVVISRG